MKPKIPIVAQPIMYIFLRRIRSEICPESGMVTAESKVAQSTAVSRRSRETWSTPVP